MTNDLEMLFSKVLLLLFFKNVENINFLEKIVSSNKFELEYDSGKNYLYGYIDGYEIAKLPLSDFECQGYGIMVTSGTTIWADDVGVYGNEVESDLDLSRRTFSLKGSINPLNLKQLLNN